MAYDNALAPRYEKRPPRHNWRDILNELEKDLPINEYDVVSDLSVPDPHPHQKETTRRVS